MSMGTNDAQAGGGGPQGVFFQRALQFAGLANDETTASFFDDFLVEPGAAAVSNWQASPGGTATITNAFVNGAGGLLTFATGATASFNDLAGNGKVVNAPATTRWYCAFREKPSTVLDATTTLCGGLFNTLGNKSIMAGFFGALNAANYGVQYDGAIAGSFLSFGVAKDTNFHIFELYCLGDGVIRARIDKGAEVNAVMSAAGTADHTLYHRLANGATAANQSSTMDWFLWAGGRI